MAGMVHEVQLSRRALKQLRRIPRHIVIKLQAWVEAVENEGLDEVRKIPGFHDEPLSGPRRGQRSIRLSRAYRAIYRLIGEGRAELVRVEEIHKHEY